MKSMNMAVWLFKNFVPILIVLGILYTISQFKKMADIRKEIQKRFDQVLTEYLNKKIIEAKETTDSILKEYGREDEVSTEISRLLITIEKGESGDINDKVSASNALNKFRLKKDIDYERYPSLTKVAALGTFNEEDMNSLNNGVALARKEYNTYAFRYNQVASGFPVQYICKFIGFKSHYNIFGNPKAHVEVPEIEVKVEEEPETLSLNSLNLMKKSVEDIAKEQGALEEENTENEVLLEHSDVVLKPTKSVTSLSDNTNNNS